MRSFDFQTNQFHDKEFNLSEHLNSDNKFYDSLISTINGSCSDIISENEISVRRILDGMNSVDGNKLFPIFDNQLGLLLIVYPNMHADLIDLLSVYHLFEEGKFTKDGRLTEKHPSFISSNRGWYLSSALGGNVVEIGKDYTLTTQQRRLFRCLKKTVRRRERA